MRKINNQLLFSATDLTSFLGCRHAIELDRAVAEGKLAKVYRADSTLELLKELGDRHEANYLNHLRTNGRQVVELASFSDTDGVKTLHAMHAGADAIAQASLVDLPWTGYADFLLRVERPSRLGNWSYEVADTKLSSTTKAAAVLQLCLYSEMLGKLQGVTPEFMYVIKPHDEESDSPFAIDRLRTSDFMAYFRMAKRGFEQYSSHASNRESKPEPCNHCQICRWWSKCENEWRAADHLSFVAGISKSQRVELIEQGIHTLTQFADAEQPLTAYPRRGSVEAYEKIHRQAKLQLRGKRSGQPEYEFNELEQDRGFLLLPEPNAGDVYFDLEGNPHAPGGVLEYLFGIVARANTETAYSYSWCLDRQSEKLAFEDLMKYLMNRWIQFPDFHIYHYAPYEPSALKRLAMRYASYEADLDRLLTAEKFIDLYAVTRQSMTLSVESYSIKKLEEFYAFARMQNLDNVRPARNAIERAIDLDIANLISEQERSIVQTYNEDDCLSTLYLHEWLEQRRAELMAQGISIDRPARRFEDRPSVGEEQEAARGLVYRQLVTGLDMDSTDTNDRAKWLLAHLLDYFRREEKCVWWEFFRRQDMDPEELLVEKTAITGLEYEASLPIGPKGKLPTHRYRFTPQEQSLEKGDGLAAVGGNEIGSVAAIDPINGWLDIKKNGKSIDIHPASVFTHELIRAQPMPESLLEFGKLAVANSTSLERLRSARYDLLAKCSPRLKSIRLPLTDGELAARATRIAFDLDHSILPIQGPPGSGKTRLGSYMIAELARAGKRVGVTAISHKVIANLLSKTHERLSHTNIKCAHRVSERPSEYPEAIKLLKDTKAAVTAVTSGTIVGGTAWLWSANQMEQQLDYLFIDEAGQMSLAIALAAGRAAKNIILLGDPQQLEQPQLGSHPEGAEVAALNHLLAGQATVPADRGIFIEQTWRLSPSICAFTSEQFYDGRLTSRPGLERQQISGSEELTERGLVFVPVEHEGNQNRCDEEVLAIEQLVETLLQTPHYWTDSDGVRHRVTSEDILIVAPYNAQVNAIKRTLGDTANVGTVDKFQGQEAPIVIYSTTSSSAEDVPRGMSFLYSPNRLNVATSRAQCLAIIVGSPKIFEPECRTPEQISLANGFCRFLEMTK